MESEHRRRHAFSAPLFLAAALGLGCHGPSDGGRETVRGHRILDFTLLGDSALALRIETWETRTPPDTAPWPHESFVLLDRKRGTLRPLDTLPVSAGPTFPGWFFACDAGQPVSVHPPGIIGQQGACSDAYAPALDPNGYSVAFSDSQARVNLLSRDLELITFLAAKADSVMPLEDRTNAGRVFVLEWHGRGDTALWRGFANDDPSGYDSAWLARPVRMRVHGAGIRLVCGEADAREDSLACWHPEGLAGFEALAREAEGGHPEWSPETGELVYLVPPARFLFRKPADGSRAEFDAGALLDRFRP